jgi:hypothetical protein
LTPGTLDVFFNLPLAVPFSNPGKGTWGLERTDRICLGDDLTYFFVAERRRRAVPRNRLGLRNEQQSERRRLWLRRLRAEGPGGVLLRATHFRYRELPCVLLVAHRLVLRAGQ